MNRERKILSYNNYTPIKKNQASISLVFGILFLVLAVLNNFKICGFLSFVLFIIYLVIYSFQHKRLLIKYMFLLFGIVFYFIGNSICVFFQVYLIELDVTTHYNGSLSVFVFCYWLYLTLLSIIDSKLAKVCYRNSIQVNYRVSKSLSLNKFCVNYGRQFVFMLSMLMFLSVYRNPAFLLDYNRFEYSTNYLSGFLYKIRTIPILLAPIVVVSVLEDRRLKDIKSKIINIFVTYLPYIFFALWIGNKFGIFWQLFYSLAIPFTIYVNLEKIKNISLIKYVVVGLLSLFLLIIVFYIVRGNDLNAIVEKLLRRFSAQGEIWWKVFPDDISKAKGISGFIDEINDIIVSIKTKGEIKQYGVYKIMKLYGAPSYIKHYLDIDMRFSAMGFELSYCFLGILSFIIFPLVTIPIYVFIVNFYVNAVSGKDFIGAFALLRILIVYDSGVCQGDWYRFTSALDILIIILLLFSILVKRRCKHFEFMERNIN